MGHPSGTVRNGVGDGAGGVVTIRYNPNANVLNSNGVQGGEHDRRNCPLNSEHPGGVMTANVDGSVRFISQTINQNVLRLLAVRNDGHPLPDF